VLNDLSVVDEIRIVLQQISQFMGNLSLCATVFEAM
jgi:hypothetical protein